MKAKHPPKYLYSVVIFPTPEQLLLIKSYKKLLRKGLNRWYNSFNSDGHITIIQFKTELDFLMYIDEVRKFCKTITPQFLKFNSLNSFENTGAFYISPNATSKYYLDSLIIDLHSFLGFPINSDSVNAHMSIGRKLSMEEIEKAFKIFHTVDIDLNFEFDTLYVRKYNEKKKQYCDIVEEITTGNRV